LLAKGYNGLTAWDYAARTDNKELLATHWGCGREVQINLKDGLF